MRLDYWGIEQELKLILLDQLHEYTVVVEQEILFSPEMTPYVTIYCDGRSLAPHQVIAAGRRVKYHVELSIWVWTFAMELARAVKQRDDCVSEIELVLMGNRTINDKVETSWITGGRLPSTKLPTRDDMAQYSGGYLSGGEIKLIAVADATID